MITRSQQIFFAAFVLFLPALRPTVGWEDSAELVMAGRLLSPMHPPGTPLPVVISHCAQWIPMGSAAYRIHLIQAVIAAGLVCIVYAWAVKWKSEVAGLIMAIVWGCAVGMVTVHAEVYVFSLAGLTLLAWMVERWWLNGRRLRCSDAMLGGLGLGLGLSSSALLLPYLIVPGLIVIFDRKDRTKAAVMWGAGLCLGLALYGLLPLRDWHPAWMSPLNLSSVQGLWNHLSGAAFRKQYAADAYTPSSSLIWSYGNLFFLIPLGFWLLCPKNVGAWLWLCGAWLLFPWLLIPSSRAGIHFFLPSIGFTVMLAILAFRRIPVLSKVLSDRQWKWIQIAIICGILVLPWCWPIQTGHAYDPQLFLERILDPMQPGDRVYCGEIDVMFLLGYSRTVENELQDVTVIPLSNLPKSTVWNELERNPPSNRTWFDFDLPNYAHRTHRSAEWLEMCFPDGLLLRMMPREILEPDLGRERLWIMRIQSWLSGKGRTQLGYRYQNLALFYRNVNPEIADGYLAIARYLHEGT